MLWLRLRTLIKGMALGTGFWLVFIVLIGFSQTAKDIYSGLDGVFYDLLFRVKPKTRPFEKLVVVDVRDELQELRRSDYARLINQLIDGGAEVIGVDLLFIGNNDPEDDNVLVQTVSEYQDRIVLAFSLGGNQNGQNEAGLNRNDLRNRLQQSAPEVWNEFENQEGVQLPFHPLLNESSELHLGHVVYDHDFDNTLRRFPLIERYRNGFYPALALEMVRLYLEANYVTKTGNQNLYLQTADRDSLIVSIDRDGHTLINFIPFSRFTILDTTAAVGHDFRDALVLLVNSAPREEWTDSTPLYEVYPKWAIHASIASQILAQEFLVDRRSYAVLMSGVSLLLALSWLILFEKRFRPTRKRYWITLIAIVGTYLMIAYVLLIFGYYVSVVIPLVTCCGIYSLVRGPFLRQELERTRSKRTKRGLIFVAYSRKDEEFVLELADRLQKRKLNVWVDQLRLPGGVDWEQQTREALERCEKFLIILSPASVKSEEVRAELRTALDDKKPVVPVLFKSSEIPPRLKLIQHIDFTASPLDDDGKVSEIVAALKAAKSNS